MENVLGRKHLAIAEGYIPGKSNGPGHEGQATKQPAS